VEEVTTIPTAPEGGRQRQPRRERSVTESLLSIVLVLEVILVFFVSLTAFGLRAVEPAPAFIGGAVLVVVLTLTARVLRFSWGVWLGWVMQVVILATGFLLPIMFLVGAVFLALWIFCFVRGRQIDEQKAAFALSEQPPTTIEEQ
jgi:hypothetical protein